MLSEAIERLLRACDAISRSSRKIGTPSRDCDCKVCEIARSAAAVRAELRNADCPATTADSNPVGSGLWQPEQSGEPACKGQSASVARAPVELSDEAILEAYNSEAVLRDGESCDDTVLRGLRAVARAARGEKP